METQRSIIAGNSQSFSERSTFVPAVPADVNEPADHTCVSQELIAGAISLVSSGVGNPRRTHDRRTRCPILAYVKCTDSRRPPRTLFTFTSRVVAAYVECSIACNAFRSTPIEMLPLTLANSPPTHSAGQDRLVEGSPPQRHYRHRTSRRTTVRPMNSGGFMILLVRRTQRRRRFSRDVIPSRTVR